MIDGCGNIHMLFRVLMPLLKPIIAVMVIYYGVGHWNSYFDALVYVSDNNLKPLTLILRDILVTNTTTASDDEVGRRGRERDGNEEDGRGYQVRGHNRIHAAHAVPVSFRPEVLCKGRNAGRYKGLIKTPMLVAAGCACK